MGFQTLPALLAFFTQRISGLNDVFSYNRANSPFIIGVALQPSIESLGAILVNPYRRRRYL